MMRRLISSSEDLPWKNNRALADFEKDISLCRPAEQVVTLQLWTNKEHYDRLLSGQFTFEEEDDRHEDSSKQSEWELSTEEEGNGVPQDCMVCLKGDLWGKDKSFQRPIAWYCSRKDANGCPKSSQAAFDRRTKYFGVGPEWIPSYRCLSEERLPAHV